MRSSQSAEPITSVLIDLDDARSCDPGIVGAKAARLAAARRAGLPALPGVVVVAEAGRSAAAEAGAALQHEGSGGARLALMGCHVDDQLLAALRERARRLGTPLVVRSSSRLETGGAWAGAFSSFEGIEIDDLATALRGVWASAFTVDALERCEATGRDPSAVALSVLIQPQVRPACGGSARLQKDGTAEIRATKGPLRDLMQGWETGLRVLVPPDVPVPDRGPAAAFGPAAIRAAANLVHRVHDALGDDLIEWAWVDQRVVLLQTSARPAVPTAEAAAPDGLEHPAALHIARLAQRFPGALGEKAVLPWALSLPVVPDCAPGDRSADPSGDLAAALALAKDLTAQAWHERSERASEQAAATFVELRGPSPAPAIARIAALHPVDAGKGRRAIRLLEGVAVAVAERERLRGRRAFWLQTLGGARAATSGGRRAFAGSAHPGPDRWEPFVHAAIRAHARARPGVPAVPGAAAGNAVVVGNPHRPPLVAERDVLFAERPLPALSPLLWRASALVTTAGNPAAHLLEVAASLGVPAVLGIDLEDIGGLAGLTAGAFVAAVDGEQGAVAIARA